MTMRPKLTTLALAAILALSLPIPALSQAAGGGPAASLLDAAERRARDGDLGGAINDYEQLIRQFPDSPQAAEAMLRIASGRLAARDRAAALATVEKLVTTYPRAPQAAAGLLLEGRIRSDRPGSLEELEQARTALQKTWLLFPRSAFPDLPARGAARVMDGQIALRLQQDDEATSSFLAVIETEPLSPSSAEAHCGLGAALIRSGQWQAAAESFQDALAIPDATPETLALARRRLAMLHRRLLRPEAGGALWASAARVAISGAQLKRVTGVAVDDEGRTALVDSGADEVLRLTAAGAVDKRWTVRNAEKVSWGPASSVQLGARDSAIVPGETSRQFSVPGKDKALDGIRAVERDPFGRWILLAARDNGVLSFPEGRGSGRPLLRGDGDPVDLAVDGLDHLYILEKKGRRVVRLNQQTSERATVVNGAWKQAVALTVDPFGYLHVLDGGAGRIHTYDSSGNEVGAVGPLLPGNIELRKAEDLAAGGDGRLFIADARSGLIVLE